VKCRVCRGPAVLDIRRHNAAFCRDHFVKHCAEQVRRAIKDHDMIRAGERVVVAVSGGKDSLALWDLLVDLGFHRIELQIYGFNERALAHAERCGYVREGVKRRAYLRGGEWQDAVLFSLLQEELPGEVASGA